MVLPFRASLQIAGAGGGSVAFNLHTDIIGKAGVTALLS
jgi:hypothetical protein